MRLGCVDHPKPHLHDQSCNFSDSRWTIFLDSCILLTLEALQCTEFTLVHEEHPQSRIFDLQFPVLQSLLWYTHLSEQSCVIVHPAHCPALTAYRWFCHGRKPHLAGELVAQTHSEEARTAYAGAGEIEVKVHEVRPLLCGLQWMLGWVKGEKTSYWHRCTIVNRSPWHGRVL